MAKEKIRKLLREKEAASKQMNSLAGMLALLTDRNGGEISFTEEDLKSIPNAAFQIDVTKGVYTLKLSYDEKAMQELAEQTTQPTLP